MRVPRALQKLIESFEKLPGIGPKTAQRLVFYLLHVPQEELLDFAQNLESLKKNTKICSICRNVSETDPCYICSDPGRDRSTIMVVEEPLDLLVIERTGKFKGVYHCLHGAISPLENIGPDELFIGDFLKRISDPGSEYAHDPGSPVESPLKEVILATNPTMEGEATALYIKKEIEKVSGNGRKLSKITRLGMGIPTGADVQYADERTLLEAIEGRRIY